MKITLSSKVHDGDLVVDGDLRCTTLFVAGDLTVSGKVNAADSLHVSGSIQAGRGLRVARAVQAGGDLTVRGAVRAGRVRVGGKVRAQAIYVDGSIVATGSIRSVGAIHAGGRIHAGRDIRTRSYVQTPTMEVYCRSLETRELPLGREFWAALPMLADWTDAILDLANCWDEWHALAAEPGVAERLCATEFGHWSIEAQLRMFLGQAKKVAPPNHAVVDPGPHTVNMVVPALVDTPPKLIAESSDPLLAIVDDPTVTPFPPYAENESYQAIVAHLKTDGLLDIDLRAAYPDLDIDLDDIYAAITQMKVKQKAVKTQVLAELAAAQNVRHVKTNLDDFLQNSVLLHDLQVQYVGTMVLMEDADVITIDLAAIFNDIFAALGLIDGAGAIVIGLQVAVTIAQQAEQGDGIDKVEAAYDQIVGQLMLQFQQVLAGNAHMAQVLLTDWGKLERAEALITGGTLAWPADTNTALVASANSYEINLFKSMLPIYFRPTFSIWSWDHDARTNCGNTVWMQILGWGDIGWPPNQPSQDWIPYWLTNVGNGGEDDCYAAENELARIGVSIQDLTMGTGLWGSTIWAADRNAPLGEEYGPGCVTKH